MLLQDCWGEFLRMEQLFAQDRYLQRQAPVLSHPCVCRHEYEGYTRAHTHTHTMEYYYLAIRKNEVLPFAIIWMDLEAIMLSEVSQTKINAI